MYIYIKVSYIYIKVYTIYIYIKVNFTQHVHLMHDVINLLHPEHSEAWTDDYKSMYDNSIWQYSISPRTLGGVDRGLAEDAHTIYIWQ